MRPDLFSKTVQILSHPEQTTKFVSELAKKTGLAEAKVTAVIAELGLNQVQSMGAAHDSDTGAADAPTKNKMISSLRIGRSVIIFEFEFAKMLPSERMADNGRISPEHLTMSHAENVHSFAWICVRAFCRACLRQDRADDFDVVVG